MKERHGRDRGINSAVPPSGDGCVECLASGGWWFHLRRCTQCGHIGCCDSSPQQHATKHFHMSGHPVIASFEPGEEWFYDFERAGAITGVELAPPRWHPTDQPVPGPAGRVPSDWPARLNDA
jgi:Zn-finger in ubiquitin-hydrolases and other protein